MATLDSAIAQMLAAGLPQPEGITYGKIVRYGRPKKKYWYVLREYRARNNRYYVSGAFGWWDGDQRTTFKVEMDYTGIDDDERERLKRSMQDQADAQAAKDAELARKAANRAKQQWGDALKEPPESGVPYLARKGITPEQVRYFADGTLLVPMLDIAAVNEETGAFKPEIRGLQKIAPDGSKLFNKHMAKQGTLCVLGRPAPEDRIALVCEGYATGRSIRMATAESTPVFVAFDAGNLVHAARKIRQLWPEIHLVFCADDDVYINARVNARLARDYGVAFTTSILPYTVDGSERVYHGAAGDVTVVASWLQDGDGVDGVTGAFTFEGRVNPFAMTNAGMTRAHQAAAAVGNATVVRPLFKARDVGIEPDQNKLTDFNDLHAVEGLDMVTLQINAAILGGLSALTKAASPPAEPPVDGAAAAGAGGKKKKRAKASPPAGAGGDDGGGGGGDDGPSVFADFVSHRFTYIYPTESCFDHAQARVVKISAMNHAFGKGPVKWWLEWRERHTVNVEDVVFDPIGSADTSSTVNLFRGIEAKPQFHGSCERLLDLIYYLCGEDREATHTPVTDWVLRWAAYPLQHVGAKMRTAVVMYGEEGTGKNIFWGALREIYGRYGGLITQSQLQGNFNTWLSAKLFLIANEVVTAQERSYYVGYLKNLITESEIWIEPKGIDARRESNHCNFVFLSNELQPLKLGPNDRRYMVVKTPRERDKAFYDALGAELAAGGALVLFEYLLKLDLGDFNEHTKPLVTGARAELIELSMTSAQLFWRDLHDGLLPMPYAPAFMQDVYEAYQVWSVRNGEKMPAKLVQFSAQFMTMNGVTRTKPLRVIDPDIPGEKLVSRRNLKQRILFMMGSTVPPAEVPQDKWLDESVAAWREALREFKGRGRSGGRQEGGQDDAF